MKLQEMIARIEERAKELYGTNPDCTSMTFDILGRNLDEMFEFENSFSTCSCQTISKFEAHKTLYMAVHFWCLPFLLTVNVASLPVKRVTKPSSIEEYEYITESETA